MQKLMFSSTFVASRPSVISHKGLSKKAGAAVIRRRRRRSAAPVGVSEPAILSFFIIIILFLNFYSKIPSKKEPLGSSAKAADPP